MHENTQRLRQKYPLPRRACEATGAELPDDYCVGGALCIETNEGHHFPTDDSIATAITRYTEGRVSCYLMTDALHEKYHKTISLMQRANDQGSFQAAWMLMDRLLNWKCDKEF
jgi:hypothetical protein